MEKTKMIQNNNLIFNKRTTMEPPNKKFNIASHLNLIVRWGENYGIIEKLPGDYRWNNKITIDLNRERAAKILDFISIKNYSQNITKKQLGDTLKSVSKNNFYRGKTNFGLMVTNIKSTYTVDITIKYTVSDVPRVPKIFKVTTSLHKEKEDIRKRIIDFERDYPPEYIDNLEISIDRAGVLSTYDWAKIPMKSASPVEISWTDKFGNSVFSNSISSTGTCVIDAIENIGKIRGCKKKIGDRAQIVQDFNDYFFVEDCVDVEKDGVTPEQLYKYCSEKFLRLYLFDENKNCRFICKGDERSNRHIPPIVGMAYDGHFYNVNSESYKKSVIESGKVNSGKFFFSDNAREFNNKSNLILVEELEGFTALENPTGLYVFKNVEMLTYQYMHFLSTENKKYKYTSSSKGITSISSPDFKIILNADIDTISKFIPISTGTESLYSIYSPFFETHKFDTVTLSSTFYSKELHTHICENVIKSAYFYKNPEGITKDYITVDKNKAYSNIICDENIKWLVADISDTPLDYSPLDRIKQTSIYYIDDINTENKLHNILIDLPGYYIGELVFLALENNVINKSNIKKVMNCSSSVHEPKIRKIIKDLYKTYGNDAKLLTNSIIGTFGSTYVDTGKVYIDSDKAKLVSRDINQFYEHKQIISEYNHSAKGYYVTRCPDKKENFKSNILMNAQIVQKNRIVMFQMAKKCGGELMGGNTDSLILKNPTYIPDHTPEIFEGWKHEKTKTRKRQIIPIKNKQRPNIEQVELDKFTYHIPPPFKDLKFNDEFNVEDCIKSLLEKLEHGNVSLLGHAGTGKTHLAKQLISHIGEDRCKVICPTHVATTNFKNAETCHSFLCINHTGAKIGSKNYMNHTYVIVDEISMIDDVMLKNLISLQHRYTKIRYLFMGDFAQLSPVNCDKDMEKMYQYITCAKFTLEKLKRVENLDDESYYLTMKQARNNIEITYNFEEDLNTESKLHLSYTNVKRREINRICMDKYKPPDCVLLETIKPIIEEKSEEEKSEKKSEKKSQDIKSQDTYLYVGLPLIAVKSNKQGSIKNGFRYTIIEIFKTKGKSVLRLECVTCTTMPVITIEADSQFLDSFTVCYCMTIHKSQGQTIMTDYTIHEFYKLDKRLTYVALSRAKKLSQIKIVY